MPHDTPTPALTETAKALAWAIYKETAQVLPGDTPDIVWRAQGAERQRGYLAAARALPVPVVPEGWRRGQYSYTALFRAIGDAVRWRADQAIEISVERFEQAMLTAAPSAPAAQPKDASPSDLPPPKRAFDGLRMTSVEHDARASQPDLSADPSLEEIDAAAAIIAAEEDREYIFRNVLSHSLTTDQELRARAEGPWYSLENLPTFIANRDDHRRQVATWRAKARDVIVLARKPLADEIGRLRAEVERQGGVIADMAANGVDDVAGDALDDRDDAIEALQARATAAEAERDRLLSDRVALMVERDAALSRERAMREALEPFRAWAVYQIERAMPQAVAADGGTLVLGEERYGDEPACPVVYVGDLRKLAALTTSAPAQPSLPERFEAAVSKAEAAPAQQGAGEAPYDPTAEMLAAGVEALSDPDVTTPAGRAGLVWRSMARAAGLTEGAEHG